MAGAVASRSGNDRFRRRTAQPHAARERARPGPGGSDRSRICPRQGRMGRGGAVRRPLRAGHAAAWRGGNGGAGGHRAGARRRRVDQRGPHRVRDRPGPAAPRTRQGAAPARRRCPAPRSAGRAVGTPDRNRDREHRDRRRPGPGDLRVPWRGPTVPHGPRRSRGPRAGDPRHQLPGGAGRRTGGGADRGPAPRQPAAPRRGGARHRGRHRRACSGPGAVDSGEGGGARRGHPPARAPDRRRAVVGDGDRCAVGAAGAAATAARAALGGSAGDHRRERTAAREAARGGRIAVRHARPRRRRVHRRGRDRAAVGSHRWGRAGEPAAVASRPATGRVGVGWRPRLGRAVAGAHRGRAGRGRGGTPASRTDGCRIALAAQGAEGAAARPGTAAARPGHRRGAVGGVAGDRARASLGGGLRVRRADRRPGRPRSRCGGGSLRCCRELRRPTAAGSVVRVRRLPRRAGDSGACPDARRGVAGDRDGAQRALGGGTAVAGGRRARRPGGAVAQPRRARNAARHRGTHRDHQRARRGRQDAVADRAAARRGTAPVPGGVQPGSRFAARDSGRLVERRHRTGALAVRGRLVARRRRPRRRRGRAGHRRHPPRPRLACLVAELRSVVCDPDVAVADPERQQRAAHQLARLAEAGVRGAHPDQWYGTSAPSSDVGLWDRRTDRFRCRRRRSN